MLRLSTLWHEPSVVKLAILIKHVVFLSRISRRLILCVDVSIQVAISGDIFAIFSNDLIEAVRHDVYSLI